MFFPTSTHIIHTVVDVYLSRSTVSMWVSLESVFGLTDTSQSPQQWLMLLIWMPPDNHRRARRLRNGRLPVDFNTSSSAVRICPCGAKSVHSWDLLGVAGFRVLYAGLELLSGWLVYILRDGLWVNHSWRFLPFLCSKALVHQAGCESESFCRIQDCSFFFPGM